MCNPDSSGPGKVTIFTAKSERKTIKEKDKMKSLPEVASFKMPRNKQIRSWVSSFQKSFRISAMEDASLQDIYIVLS